MNYEIYNEDCLEGMKKIPDGSVDMILTDLPYGTTDCDFDKRLPFEPMWEQFLRVTKKKAAIALFANGKFLIELAASNLKHYRYDWIWEKHVGMGFFNANKMPLRCHEKILIFYQQLPTYNPQMRKGKPYFRRHKDYGGGVYQPEERIPTINDGQRYPRDVQKFNATVGIATRYHPTQKPVPLLEYLIKTYTNEGEVVLDATMGSGSTGVAAVNTNRRFIGFELEKNFFEIAKRRIDEAIVQREQSLFR